MSDIIDVTCKCGCVLEAPRELLFQTAQCPNCNQPIRVEPAKQGGSTTKANPSSDSGSERSQQEAVVKGKKEFTDKAWSLWVGQLVCIVLAAILAALEMSIDGSDSIIWPFIRIVGRLFLGPALLYFTLKLVVVSAKGIYAEFVAREKQALGVVAVLSVVLLMLPYLLGLVLGLMLPVAIIAGVVWGLVVSSGIALSAVKMRS